MTIGSVFTPLGILLKTLPKRSKTPSAIVAIHVRKAFEDSLKNVGSDLPAEITSSIRATVFKNGTLSVSCPQLVAAELSMRSGALLEDINKTLGKKVVKNLRFRNR